MNKNVHAQKLHVRGREWEGAPRAEGRAAFYQRFPVKAAQ